MLADLDARVEKIVISSLKENTFYASIHLQVGGEEVAVDSRPSDAIAVALRTRAPILVDEDVIANAKTLEFNPDKANSEQLSKWLEGLPAEELGKDTGTHQGRAAAGIQATGQTGSDLVVTLGALCHEELTV